jgi:hypothetical protein
MSESSQNEFIGIIVKPKSPLWESADQSLQSINNKKRRTKESRPSAL